MSAETGARWYVANTHARSEAKAALHLGRQGFSTYLPRYLKRRRHARKVEIVPAPLFPRYLFVAVDVGSQRWRSIESTIGVSRLVRNGSGPAPLDDLIITELRGREDPEGFVKMSRRQGFAVGDKIQIMEGAFASCLGLFEGAADVERVTVLLDLLGRKVRVALNADFIAAA